MPDSGDAFTLSIVGCALLTTAAIFYEHWRLARPLRLDGPNVFLLLLTLLAIYYTLETNQTLTGNRMALSFFGGLAGGSVGAWILLHLQAARNGPAMALVFAAFAMSAIAISVYPNSTHEISHYLGQARWSGPWWDPNHYGVFIAVGILVEIALILVVALHWLRSNTANESISFFRSRRALACLAVLLLLALMLSLRALMHSFSRGAWLACAAGAGLLCWELSRLTIAEPCYQRIKTWAAHAMPRLAGRLRLSALILVATGAGAYGQLRDLPVPWVSRALSLTNPHDLSWGNRLAAWRGGLQMMTMRAPHGAGWGEMLAQYDDYHRPLSVKSPLAIKTNDYVMLGCVLGLPGLLCFAGYAMGCLRRGEDRGAEYEIGTAKPHGRKGSIFLECSPPIFRAIAVTLLFACGTNGIIFTWPFGALLWATLAASRSASPSSRAPHPRHSSIAEHGTDRTPSVWDDNKNTARIEACSDRK